MDSIDLEREKGITILAKNTAVPRRGHEVQHHRHAGPRRLRRRGRARADDGRRRAAARRRERGAAAADALRAAQGARGAAAGRPRRQQGRPARRAREEVVNEVYELFLDLDADEAQIEFPIVYATRAPGRAGRSRTSSPRPRPALRRRSSRRARRRRTTPSTRCRRSSRTSTRRRTSAGSRSAASATARCARARRSRGAAPTGTIDERARDRALHHRGARPRARRRGRTGRDRRDRGHPRGHDRRDDRRPGRSAPAARHSRSTSRRSRSRSASTRRRSPARRAIELTAWMVKARLDQELVGNVSLRVNATGARTRGRCRAAASCSSRCSSS